MDLSSFLHTFVPLLVIVDPFASLALFISLTSNMTEEQVKKTMDESVIYGFLILIFFAFAGIYVLDFFGISIQALEIAGGLLMLFVGIEMVREGDKPRVTKRGEEVVEEIGDVGVVPLATPMLAGPGAISLIIILMETYDPITVLISLTIVFAIVYIFFYFSSRIFKYLGKKGSRAFTRILGLLVAAFAIQYMLNGLGGWIAHVI
ncbi:MAG: MarC family protein [Thermoplasmata archaeon]|jgi:multiple antibiotic resistance protein|nr:MarC family protein [Thermoplasmatales archaeon]PMP74283.1 MAG: antibiotic resistance protein MarC [Aciduliprofundum sp.]HEU13141.1 MarC family protein [Euryarchaeota archaeon]